MDKYYPNFDETFSRYIYTIEIERPSSAIWKVILPVFFIMLIGWFGFFVPHSQLEVRATLGLSALIAAIAFHITIITSLPPTGYLTLADKIMISSYAFLTYVLAIITIVERSIDKKKPEKALKINRASIILSLI